MVISQCTVQKPPWTIGFGPLMQFAGSELTVVMLLWFRRHLRGRDVPTLQSAFRSTRAWPPYNRKIRHIQDVSGRIFRSSSERNLGKNKSILIKILISEVKRCRWYWSGLLAVPRTYLFSVMRYPYTAQVRPWADTQTTPCGGVCDMYSIWKHKEDFH